MLPECHTPSSVLDALGNSWMLQAALCPEVSRCHTESPSGGAAAHGSHLPSSICCLTCTVTYLLQLLASLSLLCCKPGPLPSVALTDDLKAAPFSPQVRPCSDANRAVVSHSLTHLALFLRPCCVLLPHGNAKPLQWCALMRTLSGRGLLGQPAMVGWLHSEGVPATSKHTPGLLSTVARVFFFMQHALCTYRPKK